MTKRILEIISLLTALLSAIMAYSDQLKPITDLSPYFAHLWPILGAGALVLKITASVLGDWLAKRSAGQGGTLPPGVGSLLLVSASLWLGACSTQTGNPTTDTRNAKINATGSYIAQKTLQVAFATVLNAAVSQADSSAKSNYLDGLALGFRTQEGSLLTSTDVQQLVSIWTPAKPHWAALGSQLASVYAQANPQTPQQAQAVLEAIATGLDDTTNP